MSKGEKNVNWKGGIAEYPDHYKLKTNRKEILKKVGGRCEMCGGVAKIVHHKDESKDNHELDNLMALCYPCHVAIHGSEIPWGRPTSVFLKHNIETNMSVKELATILHTTQEYIYTDLANPKRREKIKAVIEKIESMS